MHCVEVIFCKNEPKLKCRQKNIPLSIQRLESLLLCRAAKAIEWFVFVQSSGKHHVHEVDIMTYFLCDEVCKNEGVCSSCEEKSSFGNREWYNPCTQKQTTQTLSAN